MFGKIKKCLTSLALAASLAIAPMNVYATNKEGSAKNSNGLLCPNANSTDAIKTPIKVTIASSYSWTVVVPASFDLNEQNTTNNANSPFSQTDTISIKGSPVLSSKTFTVTPTLNRETKYSDSSSYPIDMAVTANTEKSSATVTNDVISFTQDRPGDAKLTVSINENNITIWKTNEPDGLKGVTVANITYLIAGNIFDA